MKKASVIIISILFIIIGALMFIAAPYFAAAKFNIANATKNNVSLSGKWRDNEKNIGTLKPEEGIEFSIDDEAAITITATFDEHNIIHSQPLFFTSGMNILFEIHQNEIKAGYGNTPNEVFKRDEKQHGTP